MGYEIDILAVGEGERSGDAMAVRFGNLHGRPDEQFGHGHRRRHPGLG